MLTMYQYRVRCDEVENGYIEVNVLAYTPGEAEEKLRKAYPDAPFVLLLMWHTIDIE